MKYIECEDCYGTGEIMTPKLYPNGYTEVTEICDTCNGEGCLEIKEENYEIY